MSSNDSNKHTTAERVTLAISVLVLAAVMGLTAYSQIARGGASNNQCGG